MRGVVMTRSQHTYTQAEQQEQGRRRFGNRRWAKCRNTSPYEHATAKFLDSCFYLYIVRFQHSCAVGRGIDNRCRKSVRLAKKGAGVAVGRRRELQQRYPWVDVPAGIHRLEVLLENAPVEAVIVRGRFCDVENIVPARNIVDRHVEWWQAHRLTSVVVREQTSPGEINRGDLELADIPRRVAVEVGTAKQGNRNLVANLKRVRGEYWGKRANCRKESRSQSRTHGNLTVRERVTDNTHTMLATTRTRCNKCTICCGTLGI